MFDKSKPNAIIFSDVTSIVMMNKALGPYKVANALRLHGVETVVISHMHIFSYEEFKDILAQLVNPNTLFVGFNPAFCLDVSTKYIREDGGEAFGEKDLTSLTVYGAQRNAEIVKLIKELSPSCATVVGGPGSAAHNYRVVDYVMVGFAESSIVNLVDHLRDKTTTLRGAYKTVYGPIEVVDMVAEGYDFDNEVMRYLDIDTVLPGETLHMELSRGCIFDCAFCSTPLRKKKKNTYIRTKESIKEEMLSNYEQFGVTRYVFVDQTVNETLEKVRMIYEISKELPFKLEYRANLRIELLIAYPEMIQMLGDSGMRCCFFGIETLNSKSSRVIGKIADEEKIVAVLKRFKDEYPGIVTNAGFIFGLPGDTAETMRYTAEKLINGDLMLDSWEVTPLRIRKIKHDSNVDLEHENSNIDMDYAGFGYAKTGTRVDKNEEIIEWQHGDMTYVEMEKLASHTIASGDKNSRLIFGLTSFHIANLGFDLEYTLHKHINEVAWSEIVSRKKERAALYKKLICDKLNVVLCPI